MDTSDRRWTAALVLLAVAGCGNAPPDAASEPSVRDSAGIRIVDNPGPDRAADLSVVRIAELAPPDSALTATPWGTAADPGTGRIYVADRTSPRVVVFDASGRYVETLGRAGEGPGEFRNPGAVSLGPSGSLSVLDAGRGVVSRWSSTGRLINETPAPVSYWGPGLYDGPAGLVTVTSERSGRALDQQLLRVTADDTVVLHSVRQEMVSAELPCFQGPMPRLLSPTVVWTARRDTVYALRGPGYRLDAYVDGTLVGSVRRTVAPLRVTEEMAADRARAQFRGFLRRCGVPAERLVQAVGYRERISPVQWMTLDPNGRLWVARSPGDLAAEEVDVLAAGGHYRGTLETSIMPVAFVTPSRFAGLTLDRETGRTGLGLYELRPDGDGEGTGRAAGAAGSRSSSVRERPAWAPPVRRDLREFRDCPDCPVMVELPPGRFTMGAPDGEWPASEIPTRPDWTEEAERPRVEVTIGYRLAMGKYEVTFDQWDACVEAGGCTHEPDDEGWGRDDRPVIHVSRSDAREYVRWLSERTGREYRLPSEAEWEYGARAGTETAFWWGDDIGRGRVPCDGCGTRWDEHSTAPVGSFPANPWGLHDMLSNVEEWVADCWHETHRGNPGDGSARTTSSPWWKDSGWASRRGRPCQRPVERGGAFGFYPWALRAAARSYYWPNPNWHERKSDSQGFRVARTVGDAEAPEQDETSPVRHPPAAPDRSAGEPSPTRDLDPAGPPS